MALRPCPIGFFVSRIRDVADRLGLKGRIFMYVSKTFSVNNVLFSLHPGTSVIQSIHLL